MPEKVPLARGAFVEDTQKVTPALPRCVDVELQSVVLDHADVQRPLRWVNPIDFGRVQPARSIGANDHAQIAVQQRVSGNLLLTFSTNVTSTQNQAVQLEYQPKRQVTISVLRDEYGGYGFDVKWHKIF